MPFGFNFSFAIWFGDVGPTQAGPTRETRTEAALARTAAAIQQEADAERALQLELDNESLHLLEAAAAASSARAKRMDRESLAVLEQATRGRETRKKTYRTPPKAFMDASRHRPKDTIGCRPLTFTTPTTNNSSDEASKPRNEFEAYLIREAAARAGAVSPFNGSNGMLRMTRSEPTTTSSDRRRKVDSVYGWFDEVERKDARDEWQRLEAGVPSSASTPSPTSRLDQPAKGKGSIGGSGVAARSREARSNVENAGLGAEKETIMGGRSDSEEPKESKEEEVDEDVDQWDLV